MERKYYYAEFHLVGLKSKGSPEIYGKNYVLTTSEEKAKEKIISYYGFGKKNQIRISEITNLDEDTLIKIHNSNIKLLDRTSLSKEARERKSKYNSNRIVNRYNSGKIKHYRLTLDTEKDKELIEKLENTTNKTDYIRHLIKSDIDKDR